MVRMSIPHRYRSAVPVLVVFVVLTSLALHFFGYSYWPSWIDTARSRSCVVPEPVPEPAGLHGGSRRRPRIALLETSGTHDEVSAAVVYAFGSQSHIDLSYFSRRQRFGIGKILDGFPLASHYGTVKSLYAFTQYARQCPPPDIVVSITCELDLASKWTAAALRHLVGNGITQLFCVVHHGDRWNLDYGPNAELAQQWSAKGKVDFLGLSQHTVDYLVNDTRKSWDHEITAHAFPPVFPVDQGPPLDAISLAMQGNYDPTKRDYEAIFGELSEAISLAKKSPEPRKVSLHLVGHGRHKPDIPDELADSVVFDEGKSYPDFYALLSQAFAVIPAFATDDYYTVKASSTIPAALIAGAPLIANKELLSKYTYVNPESVWLSKPGEGEMETVQRVINDWDEFQRKRALTKVTTNEILAQNRENFRTWIDEMLEEQRQHWRTERPH